MKKKLYLILLISILSNQTFASIVEGHSECEPFEAKIEQLNQNQSPYFSYRVFPSYNYENDIEVPTCLFQKITSGGVSLKLEISNTITFVEVNEKLNAFERKLSNLASGNQIECTFSSDSYGLHKSIKSVNDKYNLTFYGKVICYNFENLDDLVKLDIEKLLNTTIQGTEFKFEIEGEPSPTISGTTIHN